MPLPGICSLGARAALVALVFFVSGFVDRPALSQSAAVDLELVLAADGSGSIDDAELALQREGYADAISSRKIVEAIQFGPRGRIAVAYVEWGSPASQHTIVDWTIIEDKESAGRFADICSGRTECRSAFLTISPNSFVPMGGSSAMPRNDAWWELAR